ncbi:MAG TPA: hypothetical protein VHJ38_11435, partial [Nitrososphaeraceae archaeon]|nr:hypothetical protein [Nitrososphaeraceae archaeon]
EIKIFILLKDNIIHLICIKNNIIGINQSINQCTEADKFIVKLCILFLSKSQRKLANTFFNINQYI